jgi:hypothetical protein
VNGETTATAKVEEGLDENTTKAVVVAPVNNTTATAIVEEDLLLSWLFPCSPVYWLFLYE